MSMTESEALKWTTTLKNWNSILPEAQEALSIAEKMFEEIQQYRAIGTIEQIMNMQFTTESEHDEVLRYRAIGTVSEFRELKEKATAKKPIETERNNLTVWDCPQCGNELYSGQKFCDECGKAIADEKE